MSSARLAFLKVLGGTDRLIFHRRRTAAVRIAWPPRDPWEFADLRRGDRRIRSRRIRGDRASLDTSASTTRLSTTGPRMARKPGIGRRDKRRYRSTSATGPPRGPNRCRESGRWSCCAEDLEHHLGRRFDHKQQPHRLVDFDALPGEPGAQIAGGAIHHAHERSDVMRQLRPASPAQRVDAGEEVLQVDSFADGYHGVQDAFEDRGVGVLLRRIVRHQERSSIEKQPARALPAADDTDGVRGVAKLGPRCARCKLRTSTCR